VPQPLRSKRIFVLTMKLPDDIVRQELMHYLTVYDIVRLDIACMNHEFRPQLLEKISGVVLEGDVESIRVSLFTWLGIRQIYWINMIFSSLIIIVELHLS